MLLFAWQTPKKQAAAEGRAAAEARCPEGMVLVKGGTFQFGPEGESKADPYFVAASTAAVQSFCLDAREITLAKFRDCANCGPLSETGDCRPQRDRARSVACVTWTQADRYCRSANAASPGRLPTEQEWEFAARGAKGRAHPWDTAGVMFDVTRPNFCLMRQERTGSGGACVPGESRSDHTPEGIFDLGYNVSEWTSSKFCRPGVTPCFENWVVRGGNWTDRTLAPVTAYRMAREEDFAHPAVGFRCAADLIASR